MLFTRFKNFLTLDRPPQAKKTHYTRWRKSTVSLTWQSSRMASSSQEPARSKSRRRAKSLICKSCATLSKRQNSSGFQTNRRANLWHRPAHRCSTMPGKQPVILTQRSSKMLSNLTWLAYAQMSSKHLTRFNRNSPRAR